MFPPCDFSACLLVLASSSIACRTGAHVAGVAHRKGAATREEVYRLLRHNTFGGLKSDRQRLLFPSNRVIQFILTERSRNPPRDFYHYPPHWTLKCCYGAFCTIWVRSGPFGCFMKLGAKQAELVQKFVPRSRVEFFATNAPNPPHCTLN